MVIIFKRKAIYIFTLALLFVISLVILNCNPFSIYPVLAKKRLPIIVVDAGHGGRDPGAVVGGIYEKSVNLDVAKRLKKELNKRGYKVIMTRTGDTNLVNWKDNGSYQRASLWQRAHISQKYRGAILISIHCNSDRNGRYYGAQTFYHSKSTKGKELAIAIQKELVKMRYTKRKAVAGDYYLLKNTSIPTVIVEMGYLSNSKDRAFLSSSSQRAKLAAAIARGISNSAR